MSESLRIVPAFPNNPPSLTRNGSEAILTHPATGLEYRLNATAASIWEGLREATTLGALAERVSSEFDITPRECAATVEQFVERMWELGFVNVAGEDSAVTAMRRRYLGLLKRALVNLIYPEHELRIETLENGAATGDRIADERLLRDIRYTDSETFAGLIAAKADGRNWRRKATRYSHTMIGMRRLDNIEWCATRIFATGVPGDFLEAGVCQGGAAIFMRALQVVYGQSTRQTWAADSFEGLPAPATEADQGYDFSESRHPWLAASLQAVQDNFRTYDLLTEEVRFLKGWFSESLPSAPVGALAMLRIDADLYASTRDVLEALYDKVSPGGFIIIDDYHPFPPCRLAVDTFREERQITAPLTRVDWAAVYWQKPS